MACWMERQSSAWAHRRARILPSEGFKTRGVSEGQAAGVFGFDEEHAAIKLDDGNRKIEDALLRCGKEHRYPEDSRAWTGFIFKIQFGNDELQIERLCRPIMQFQLDPCGAAAFGKRSF